MTDYIHLIGAEDVARAGHNMSGAAEQMQRAASNMEGTAERMVRSLDDHCMRLGELLQVPASMSMRDFFAASAMTGLQANVSANSNNKRLAERAYEIADSMLEARK